MDPKALFRMVQQGQPEWDVPRLGHGSIGICGRHSSYQRLAPDLLHERRVCLSGNGALIVEDRLGNEQGQPLRWHFLVHPSVRVTVEANRAVLQYAGGTAVFEAPAELQWSIEDAWYSSGYGVRVRTVAIVTQSSTLSNALFVGAASSGPSYAQARESAHALWSVETEGLYA